ncbi:hypothetical protein K466DRAFT_588954 [Polyporus arcularius HHB13444]|uniref:GST N-terminal domain-containing protein n=1 Tax=Polyporus arcularius HHB13444 TaxID=1314778 RepID=A0A5C3P4L7_9APHY|nr:hypothetical protein K466DRAFT_588954 [Polyporus arcularius HHB13444]
MPEPIVFYDIPANVRGIAFSGNTLKTRFSLNYKGLPFKTVWVEYPDIARTCKELGIGPTGTWPDGSPMYTLPAIHDPSTGTSIANSTAIARYLDATYPDTPRVIPEGTEAFHEAFEEALAPTLVPHLLYIHFPAVYGRLNEASKAYFKAARESVLGGKMEQWSPLGSETREQQWVKLEAGLGRIERWLTADGKERRFFMGDKPSFADFVLGARLLGLKRAIGEEHKEWKRVEQWHGGRWARLLLSMEAYAT